MPVLHVRCTTVSGIIFTAYTCRPVCLTVCDGTYKSAAFVDVLLLQVLKATGTEDPKYPHPFELTVKVELLDDALQQELSATNTGVCSISTQMSEAVSTQDGVAVLGTKVAVLAVRHTLQ